MLLAIILAIAGACCVFSMYRRATHPELFPAHRPSPTPGRRSSMAYRLLHPDEPAAPAAAAAAAPAPSEPPATDDSLEDSPNSLVRTAYSRAHQPDLARSMVMLLVTVGLEDRSIHRGVAEGDNNTRAMFTARACSPAWVEQVLARTLPYPDCHERVDATLLAGGFREVGCQRSGHAEPMVFPLPFVAPAAPAAAEEPPAEAPRHHRHRSRH